MYYLFSFVNEGKVVFHSCVPMGGQEGQDLLHKYSLTFFGAKKEAKKHPPHPVLPLYWKAQLRIADTRRFFRVLVWLSSLCPCGVRHGCLSAAHWLLLLKKVLKCCGFEIIAYLCALKQSSKESRTWNKVINMRSWKWMQYLMDGLMLGKWKQNG